MGRTGARLAKLEKSDSYADLLFAEQIKINSVTKEALTDIEDRLETIEDILTAEVSKEQLADTRQKIHDANIRSISDNLDEATFMISQLFEKLDKLQNTVWRRFCRWVRLLFTV